jgi:hypothetical protein
MSTIAIHFWYNLATFENHEVDFSLKEDVLNN